jgi:hypothetical protein
MICMGKEAAPPEHFVREMVDSLKYHLKKEGKVFTCDHVSTKEVEDKKSKDNSYILISWKSAEISISVCGKCASKKSNIVASINQNMGVPKPEEDFDIDIVSALECKVDCVECNIKKHLDVSDELQKAYFSGTISDRELLEKHLSDFEEFLKSSEKKVFIHDENCYGENMEEFIKELNPTDEEKVALATILEKIDTPVVVSKATPNKVLNMYWDDYGIEALKAIVGDEKTAKRLYEKADRSNSSPSQILKEASIYTKERDIISALPKYRSLPEIAKFADSIARIYLTQGKEDSLRAIEHYKGGDTRIKSVAYAFLLALDQGAGKKWQYTKTEIDFAQFLRDPAFKLLKSKPGDYHDNLQSLLSATGSTKKLTLNQ